MIILLIMLIDIVSATKPGLTHPSTNLTHSSYYHYNFEDYTFEERYNAEYLKGKHCANLYLIIDHNTESTGVDLFQQCVEDSYPAAFEEYELTNLRHVFTTLFTVSDDDHRNSFLYEEKKDSLYGTFMDIQHDFGSFKVDIVSSARRFVHPIYALTMASTPLQGRQALNQSIDIINDLKQTITTISELYDHIIQAKSNDLDFYKANYVAARNKIIEIKKTYQKNVSTLLKRLTVRPSTTINCPAGHYCTTSNVTACPAGTFQPKVDMTSPLACIMTPLQTYSLAGAKNYTLCASNNHMGATACHLRSLGEVIANMYTAGPITENFYISFDMTRQFITSTSTLLNLTQTAEAASTVGSLAAPIQALVSSGSSVENAYQTVLLGAFQSVYSSSTYVSALQETDFQATEVVGQTNLMAWSGPYIDGSTSYNLTLTGNTWSVYYVPTGVVILSGTRSGKTLTGGTLSTRGMIEFPVSSALAYGYPIVYKDGTPIHSYQLQ